MKQTSPYPNTHETSLLPENRENKQGHRAAGHRGRGQGLVSCITLSPPHLPVVLEGLTIAMVGDLGIRELHGRHSAILKALGPLEIDLLAFTGDLMAKGRESGVAGAHRYVMELLRAANPQLGAFGVFGDQDSPNLRKRLASAPIQFLNNQAFGHHRLPLTILGLDTPPGGSNTQGGDLLKTLRSQTDGHDELQFRILLTHGHAWLGPAAGAGLDLMLTAGPNAMASWFAPTVRTRAQTQAVSGCGLGGLDWGRKIVVVTLKRSE